MIRMSSRRTRPGDQFWMPAPASSEKPSRIVSLDIVTCIAVGWISNRRSMPRCSSGEPSGGKPPSRIVALSPVAPDADDRHGVVDVEVAGRVAVLVDDRDLELVGARADLDPVDARVGVRLGDRGAQRAEPAERRAAAVARAGVGGVRRTVDDEGLPARLGGGGTRDQCGSGQGERDDQARELKAATAHGCTAAAVEEHDGKRRPEPVPGPAGPAVKPGARGCPPRPGVPLRADSCSH